MAMWGSGKGEFVTAELGCCRGLEGLGRAGRRWKGSISVWGRAGARQDCEWVGRQGHLY